jgi:hypothetical protein
LGRKERNGRQKRGIGEGKRRELGSEKGPKRGEKQKEGGKFVLSSHQGVY